MSLNVYLNGEFTNYSRNITHNLNRMAAEAHLYEALWHPDEIFEAPKAKDLIPLLNQGLEFLRAAPEHFLQFSPPNGWGSYKGLVEFVAEYLVECLTDPEANVTVRR